MYNTATISETSSDVTGLLDSWASGEKEAFAELMPHVVNLIHASAKRLLRPGHTLQATELVHEVYIELCDYTVKKKLANRYQFLRLVTQVMRHYLADYHQRKQAVKHGGQLDRLPWEEDLLIAAREAGPEPVEFMDLDRALIRLKAINPVGYDVVKLRFIRGMTYEETAKALGRTPRNIRYKWVTCRPLLYRLLVEEGESSDGSRRTPVS